MNTQEYGRRPYGVGFLVIGQDTTGPHLYEFSPSGNAYEYYAMSIGARSQSAKTYLEKHYESFADCEFPSLRGAWNRVSSLSLRLEWHHLTLQQLGTLEQLVQHGLHALRETLQQDKELNLNNTSIGIIGPASDLEENVPIGGPFRILENDKVVSFLATIIPKEAEGAAVPPPAATAAAAATTDEDVQMQE